MEVSFQSGQKFILPVDVCCQDQGAQLLLNILSASTRMKEKTHTHTSKSFCGGRSILSSPSGLYAHFCLCYCSIHRVPAPHSTRVVLSPIIASVFGQKICHELCSVIETSGEQSSRSLFIPMLPMGGKTESQLEMYALRRMEKRLSHRCFGCAVTVFKPAETRRFA